MKALFRAMTNSGKDKGMKDHLAGGTEREHTEQHTAAVARMTLKQRRKRMHNIVAAMQQYVATYDKQPLYEDYSDETFISDMLYGIGIALDGRYKFAKGFYEWKLELRRALDSERTTAPDSRDQSPDNAKLK